MYVFGRTCAEQFSSVRTFDVVRNGSRTAFVASHTVLELFRTVLRVQVCEKLSSRVRGSAFNVLLSHKLVLSDHKYGSSLTSSAFA